MLYLVRHAKAGSRADWVGADRLRPLTEGGVRQAEALADRLAPLVADDAALVSSPYVRCVQTIEPLATRLGRSVKLDERLAEEAGFAGALELLADLPDGSVLCSHGDVIPETVEALLRRGCVLSGLPESGKGAVWVLTRRGTEVVHAEAWPPPDSRSRP